jgi:hypothetical protein
MKPLDVKEYSVPKPCDSCNNEKRDKCWRSSEFCCDEFRSWLHDRGLWIDDEIKKQMLVLKEIERDLEPEIIG